MKPPSGGLGVEAPSGEHRGKSLRLRDSGARSYAEEIGGGGGGGAGGLLGGKASWFSISINK